MRLIKLPPWNLTNKLPAFHDVESASSIQMTAKLYEYMKMFQADYEKFIEELNIAIDEYNTEINTDFKCFEEKITKIIHDYIHIIDTKLAHQDREIEEAIVYIKENLETGITSVLEQMKESGELTTALTNAFEELGTRVTELELDNTEIMETIGSLNQNVYNNESRIIQLEDKEAELREISANTNNQVTDINNRLNTNETTLQEIIESGTNDDGTYIKYSDGTLICYKTVEGQIDITKAWGSLFISENIEFGNHAHQFIETPVIQVTCHNKTGSQFFSVCHDASVGGGFGSNVYAGSTCLARPESKTGVEYKIDITAYGKWK